MSQSGPRGHTEKQLHTSRRIISVLVAAAAMLALAAPAQAARWNYETLDGAGGANGRISANVGSDNSVAIWNNTPHVWYYDTTNQDLRHAWWSGTAWFFETLDGNCPTAPCANGSINNGFVGQQNSVVIWNNTPHVFYADGSAGNLRHGWWTGTKWQFETLDGEGGGANRINGIAGEYTSATVWGGLPHVWYYDDTNADLRHAWWTGSGWAFETLDGNCPTANCVNGSTNRTVGNYTFNMVWNNEPHVFYWDFGDRDLRHAWWNGASWRFETLDGHQAGPNGQLLRQLGAYGSGSVWNGVPHVWYSNDENDDLRHAWWTGAKWQFETLDGDSTTNGRVNAEVGRYTATAVWNGTPHVWHWDVTNGDLRHAWWTGSAWQFEALDGNCLSEPCADGRTAAGVGPFSAVSVWNNEPHVWYRGASVLRHAWYG